MLLDKYQELVVESPPESNMVIVGAPGSGKTRTLTMRYCSLVLKYGLMPSRILSLTFSKKAAGEMSKRIKERLDINSQAQNQISTINAFCHRLYNDWRVRNKMSPLKVWQYGDKQTNPKFVASNLMRKHMGTTDLSIFDAINKLLKSVPDPSKDDLKDIDMVGLKAETAFKVWKEYEVWMKKNNLTDFYGQVWNVDRLMHKTPVFARMVGQRFDKIMADEGQDMFPQSFRIILKLAEESSLELYADPSQSIYGFNGAAPELVYDIEKTIPNLATYHLSNNYRSESSIVDVVNNFGPNTSERFQMMTCTKPEKPGKVKIQKTNSIADQANYIAEEIQRNNYNYSDVYVLARTNAHCSAIYQRLIQLGISANYAGNFSIWSKSHIKAGIAYLALTKEQDSPDDLDSILNIPSEDYMNGNNYSPTRFLTRRDFAGILFKDVLSGKFKAKGKQLRGVSNIVKFVERLRDLDDDRQRVADIGGAISKWAQFTGLDHFQVEDDLAMLWDKMESLDYNVDNLRIYIQKVNEARRKIKPDRNKVEVMTIHQAKGLEAPIVFLTGLCEPATGDNRKSGFHPDRNTNPNINEENCLYYVGISRAIEHLYLTYYEKSGDIYYELSSFVNMYTKKIAGMYNNV